MSRLPLSRRVARGTLVGLGIGAALACGNTGPVAADALPDTPAGRVFHAWIEPYNAADSLRLASYVRRYEPTMSVHEQLVSRRQTGPWRIVSIERSEPRRLEALLTSRPDSTAGNVAIAMYAVVDLVDGPPLRAATTFSYLGRAAGLRLPRMSAAQRATAIDSLIAKTVRNYVRLDAAHEIADSLVARRARGAYDSYGTRASFAARLDHDLRELGRDRQLGIDYAVQLPPPLPTPTPPAVLHCGIGRTSLLEGRIGYLQLYAFGIPEWDCGHQISAALSAVADAPALILDLRDATEDLPDSRRRMAYVASYLVAGCTHLSDAVDRRTARAEALWTTEGLPGRRFGGARPLYIITSTRTYSAAEELAYDLQSMGRATVVGERTAGAARVTGVGSIGDHLVVRIPIAWTVNPITRSSWASQGVQPDVTAPESDALAVARQLASEGRTPRSRVIIPASPSKTLNGARDVGTPGSLRGVRFSIDTLAQSAAEQVLSRVAGVIEFADGRGRLDVSAVSGAPGVAVNGVPVGAPLAAPGDYYLFDNAGFVLVRPATRTFSSFSLTRADFNHTGALLPGAFMMPRTPLHIDTLAPHDPSALQQHGSIMVHWHMQRRNAPAPTNGSWGMYARGWLEVADAPAVEAGVARWFEVAAALATRAEGVPVLPPGELEVTSVTGLRRGGEGGPSVFIAENLRPRGEARANIDPARLVVPADYTETDWPGFEHEPRVASRPTVEAGRWRTVEDTSSQRARSACRQAWLPEHLGSIGADTVATHRPVSPAFRLR